MAMHSSSEQWSAGLSSELTVDEAIADRKSLHNSQVIAAESISSYIFSNFIIQLEVVWLRQVRERSSDNACGVRLFA